MKIFIQNPAHREFIEEQKCFDVVDFLGLQSCGLCSPFGVLTLGNVSSFYPNSCSASKIPRREWENFTQTSLSDEINVARIPGQKKSGLTLTPIIPDKRSNSRNYHRKRKLQSYSGGSKARNPVTTRDGILYEFMNQWRTC